MRKFFCLYAIAALAVFLFPPLACSNGSANPEKSKRIVGGHEAEPGAWPWMTAVVRAGGDSIYDSQYCGGTLIHPRWVLTAAHCVYSEKAEDVEAVLGVHDLSADTGERFGVKRKILHPDYRYSTDENDFALLELSDGATQPVVRLYTGGDTLEGENGVVLGWGWTNARYPEKLLQVEVSVIPNDVCNEGYEAAGGYGENPITESMLCAGEPGKDSCEGDSGGPLLVNDGGEWKQAGIVSWGGDRCAMEDLYGVYSRVSVAVDFIRQHVALDLEPKPITLFFPHVATGGERKTDITVTNTGGTAVGGALTARNDIGTNLESIRIDLPPFGTRRISVNDEFSDAEGIGYLVFEYDSNAGSVAARASFFAEGKYRASAPAVSEPNEGDFCIPHIVSDAENLTTVSLVNTSGEAAELSLEFDNGSEKIVSLGPGGKSSFTIKSLFGESGSDINSAVVRGGGQIAGLSLISHENEKTESLAAFLLKDGLSDRMIVPHIAAKDRFRTVLTVCNTSESSQTVSFNPYGTDGEVLIPVSRTVGPGDTFTATATDLGLPADSAWLRIETDDPLAGQVVFETRNGTAGAGFSCTDAGSKNGVFTDIGTGGWAGIALANPNGQSANILLTAYDENGVPATSKTVVLRPYARLAGTVAGIFTGDAAGASHIVYSSDREVAGFRINGSPDGTELDALLGKTYH